VNPYQVVKDFEAALCEYTGAKYAVTTTSCTLALLLALKYDLDDDDILVWIPTHTYVSIPQVVLKAGGIPVFSPIDWSGSYQLNPTRVIDSARRFTSDMYDADTFTCVSFHGSKILGDTQGGAILHDNDEADAWFRKMRFDGRTEDVAPIDDDIGLVGEHCYMSPDVAARLLFKLSFLPKHNKDLPNDNYPDLSKIKWRFK